MAVIGYVQTIIMMIVLEDFQKKDDPEHEKEFNLNKIGWLVGITLSVRIISSIITSQVGFQMGLIGIKLRNVVSAMIIKKALKKPLSREKEFHSGVIINLCSSDAEQLASSSSSLSSLVN